MIQVTKHRPAVWAAGMALVASLGACRASDEADEQALPRVEDGIVRGVDPFADATAACSDGLEAAMMQALNRVRLAAGAPTVTCLSDLRELARRHALYLARNGGRGDATTHGEILGQEGYTGATLAERAAALGLDHESFWLSEGIGPVSTVVGGNSAQGVDDAARAALWTHLATVYHRSHLLTPGARYAGISARDGRVVLETLAALDIKGLEPLVHPAPGASQVPVAFESGRERPEPFPELVRMGSAQGYPVSIHFPRHIEAATGAEPGLKVERFELYLVSAATGVRSKVSTARATPTSHPALFASDAYLVPLQPLLPKANYEVWVSAHYGRFDLTRRWQFSTAEMTP